MMIGGKSILTKKISCISISILLFSVLFSFIFTSNAEGFELLGRRDVREIPNGGHIADGDGDPDGGNNNPDGGDGDDDSKCCFPAGTKITMADNTIKNIENIQIGDKIRSFDLKNNKFVITTVTQLIIKIREGVYNINNDYIKPTNDHPIYTQKTNGKTFWASIKPEITKQSYPKLAENIKKLEIGDKILTLNNTWLKINTIEYQPSPIQTYTFNVESQDADADNYFANGILVHNACDGDEPIGDGGDSNTGDGDGDSSNTGDGDGDGGDSNTGDGDGDSSNTGDGDGDGGDSNTGDGDGDYDGGDRDGDGDTSDGEGDSSNTGDGDGDGGDSNTGDGDGDVNTSTRDNITDGGETDEEDEVDNENIYGGYGSDSSNQNGENPDSDEKDADENSNNKKDGGNKLFFITADGDTSNNLNNADTNGETEESNNDISWVYIYTIILGLIALIIIIFKEKYIYKNEDCQKEKTNQEKNIPNEITN